MCCDCVCSAGTGAVCAWNWHDVLSKVICTVFSLRWVLISTPRLGVYYFLSFTLALCISVSLSRTNFKLILLFCFSMESSHFLAISYPCGTLQNVVLDFWFRPPAPNAQNFLPKICTKSPISRLVWQIDRRCLGLLGGFRGWPIQWNHAKCCEANPGIKSPNSSCMTHRPEMFVPTREFLGMADSMEPCKMLWGRPLLPWQPNLA